jgi:hypothetical protein
MQPACSTYGTDIKIDLFLQSFNPDGDLQKMATHVPSAGARVRHQKGYLNTQIK